MLTSDSGKKAIFSISENMRTPTMPTLSSSLDSGVHLNLADTSCLRPAVSEHQLGSSPLESDGRLRIDESPYTADLEYLSESIDAELHSWTLQQLPWIERAEVFLLEWAVSPA